ncbi:MAG: ABC transporter permease, partial [Candidatus Zixiibacteriota bacterium]
MITGYLKVIVRNIIRHKGYSFINIAGLAIGMTIFILIVLYAQFEYGYDTFHEQYDRICRVEQDYNGQGQFVAITHNPLGPILVEDYPEIVKSVRFQGMDANFVLAYGDDLKFNTLRGWWVEPSFFEIFSFPLLRGDPKEVLAEPNTIVLSRELADKYFPDDDPLGKTLRLNDTYDCKITGIVEDCPPNSHIRFDFLTSLSTLYSVADLNDWSQMGIYTYVVLAENAPVQEISQNIRDIFRRYQWPEYPGHAYLKPLSQLHLYSDVIGEVGPRGDPSGIYVMLAIGVFVLLIACINFMNLSTARSVPRAKEVGVRKVVGASKTTLIIQFLGESVILSSIALVIAVGLAEMLLPEFNNLVSREMTLDYLGNLPLSGGMLILALTVGVVAGSYPAFYLSAFQPAAVMKGTLPVGAGNSLTRKLLVVFQFSLSIAFIIGTFTIVRQVSYMKDQNPGSDREHIAVMQFNNRHNETIGRYESFKNELLASPAIVEVSLSRFIPGYNYASTQVDWEGADQDQTTYTNLNYVDAHFIDVYNLELLDGRNLSEVQSNDSVVNCIINETAVRTFGWQSPIGKMLMQSTCRVIGVIKDFHYATLRRRIDPIILLPFNPSSSRHQRRNIQFSIKIAPEQMDDALAYVEDTYHKHFPGDIFEYRLFDQVFGRLFRGDERTGRMVGYLALLAICISCLGLFGLASYTAERRTREIGIRKVFGAGIPGVVLLLSREFLTLVAVANLIAWPVAWYAMNR